MVVKVFFGVYTLGKFLKKKLCAFIDVSKVDLKTDKQCVRFWKNN